jgi:protein phosphatase
MPSLTYGSSTQAGRSRKNRDAVFAAMLKGQGSYQHPQIGVFIVADGIGSDRQEAAHIAVSTIAAYVQAGALLSTIRANAILQSITEAYQKATRTIQQQKLDAGVSATMALVSGETAYIGHIGCTRAYAISAQAVDCLTTDHTIEEMSLELGVDFAGDAYAPVLYRVIGQNDETPDTLIHPLSSGTALLLVSDGVYRAGAQLIEFEAAEQVVLPISEDEILHIITASTSAQDACERLVADAISRSGGDDVSAVLVCHDFAFVD